MKRKSNGYLKAFFKSLWKDTSELFTKHYLKLIGILIMIGLPFAYIYGNYVYEKPSYWTIPTFVWIPVAVFIVVYWFKLRTALAVKVESLKQTNISEKGKYVAFIILLRILQWLMIVAPFLLCFFIFKALADISIKIENIFLLLTICEAVGGALCVVDTIINLNYEKDDVNEEGAENEEIRD